MPKTTIEILKDFDAGWSKKKATKLIGALLFDRDVANLEIEQKNNQIKELQEMVAELKIKLHQLKVGE